MRTIGRSYWIIVCWLAATGAQGQQFWARDFGGVGNDHVADVKVDASGAVFVTGEFHGAMTYDGVGITSGGGIDFFVARLNPDGSLVWIKRAGSFGIDRGIKLAVRGGTVAVVGEFMGTVPFFGDTIASSGGTSDMFVATFSAATGAMQWVRTGGGTAGNDRPYGVAINSTDGVVVAGEFKGSATWSGTTLVSMPDPITLLPSVDVVVLSYSATGTLQWTQTGSAQYTDRAIDVVVDPTDAIYVAGQFSDTIAFDAVHNNAMFNATFLLKLDAAGSEQWLRRCGGAIFGHVRDLQWSSSGHLLMAGDLRGTMLWLDNVPDMIVGQDDFAFYLLDVKQDGELDDHTVLGSSSLVSARAIDERSDTIAVLGQFECSFSDLSDVYGPGLFMASGDEDLFVARYTLGSLDFVDAQQFGGAQEKLAGQIASLLNGDLLFCGSYERDLVFPATTGFTADIDNAGIGGLVHAGGGTTFCASVDYHHYAADTSLGLKDGFIARGFVRDRAPYDFWVHNDTTCVHDTLALCLGIGAMANACPDSVVHCGPLVIGIDPAFNFHIHHHKHFTGPEIDFLWSNGSTTDSLWVDTTGWYWVRCSTVNGCLSWTDSLYVTVLPVPDLPLISDDVVVNTAATIAADVHLCDPDSAWLWCANPQPLHQYGWYGPLGAVANDSTVADTSGYYTIQVTNPEGCSAMNTVHVFDHPTVPMPAIDATIAIMFPLDTDLDDTVRYCASEELAMAYTVDWTAGGLPYALPDGIFQRFRFNNCPWIDVPPSTQFHTLPVASSGWFPVVLELLLLNEPCLDDTLSFIAVDSIYVELLPLPSFSANITGPTLSCPGDTVTWMVTCTGCTNYAWYPPVLMDFGDSVWVNAADTYILAITAVDSNGCSSSGSTGHFLTHPSTPELMVDPSDGVICPDSTAIVYTNAPGTDYVWYGPAGVVPNNNDSVVVNTPGEYFMSFTDPMGCAMISDVILVAGYSTPFLNVLPDGVICANMGDSVEVQVMTTGYSSLVWAAPLGGNALTQLIGTPGTYSCSVTACGIETLLSIEIVAGTADAAPLDPGPFVLCPGDTVLLQAAPGMAAYQWDPVAVFAPELLVNMPGSYQLTVFDANGCTDTSVVEVAGYAFGEPLAVWGDTVCAGQDALLLASGSDMITWYSDAGLDALIGTGDSLVILAAATSTMFYVQQADSVCSGQAVPVLMAVGAPGEAVILGDSVFCDGGSLSLWIDSLPGGSADWMTPGGSQDGILQLVIDPVTSTDQGAYIATPSQYGCVGTPDTMWVMINASAPFTLGADTTICLGDTITFTVPSWISDPLWFGYLPDSSISVAADTAVYVVASDSAGCAVGDTVLVDVLEAPTPASAFVDLNCFGDDAVITTTGPGTMSWYAAGDTSGFISTGPVLILPTPTGDTTVYLLQEEAGCAGVFLAVSVIVPDELPDFTLNAPAIVCAGGVLIVSVSGSPTDVSWTTPIGAFTGEPLVISAPPPAATGTYTAVPSIDGCAGPPLSVYIDVVIVVDPDLGPDSTFCDGEFVEVMLPAGYLNPMWSDGSTSNSLTVTATGTYTVQAVDTNGCYVSDAITLTAVPCDPLVPTVFTPNGDGVNDAWQLGGGGFIGSHLLVFDRFGAIVYDDDPKLVPFRGAHYRTGEALSEGVYYYVLRLETATGAPTEQQGYFDLLR